MATIISNGIAGGVDKMTADLPDPLGFHAMQNGTWIATMINSIMHVDAAEWSKSTLHLIRSVADLSNIINDCDPTQTPWCGTQGDDGFAQVKSVYEKIGQLQSVPWPPAAQLPAWVESAPNISQWVRNGLHEESKEIWEGIKPSCLMVANNLCARTTLVVAGLLSLPLTVNLPSANREEIPGGWCAHQRSPAFLLRALRKELL